MVVTADTKQHIFKSSIDNQIQNFKSVCVLSLIYQLGFGALEIFLYVKVGVLK